MFCCSIRLAAFHPLKSEAHFNGLPASAATILIISCAFIEIDIGLIILLSVIISSVMVSSIPYPKPSAKLNGFTAIVIIASIAIGHQFNHIMIYVLLFCIVMYIIGGPLYLMKKSKC